MEFVSLVFWLGVVRIISILSLGKGEGFVFLVFGGVFLIWGGEGGGEGSRL